MPAHFLFLSFVFYPFVLLSSSVTLSFSVLHNAESALQVMTGDLPKLAWRQGRRSVTQSNALFLPPFVRPPTTSYNDNVEMSSAGYARTGSRTMAANRQTVMIANIGSTSFKWRLFEIAKDGERELAKGQADRIGKTGAEAVLEVADGEPHSEAHQFADYGEAIRHALDFLLREGVLSSLDDLDVVGFKAVMAGDHDPVALVDDRLLAIMEDYAPVAPAHNPPYVAAMRTFRTILIDTPLVAAFETGFHRTNPQRRRFYAVAPEWAEQHGVKRYGFHGASHRYIATRTRKLMGARKARRVISCHLGGSSSICAIRDGKSVATSMGLSPQSGLPQGSRVGDVDVYALSLMAAKTGRDLSSLLEELGCSGGLAALSGVSGEMRDIKEAVANGDERAKLAVEVYVTAVRDYVGAYLVELGGADALVFTGGIGVNDPKIRAAICKKMKFVGIVLDARTNRKARGEVRIDTDDSTAAIWVMPTNEELIVARQAAEFLKTL